jgi:signal transduction histidine kinase
MKEVYNIPNENPQPSILIVDDILENIQLLMTILADEGYRIRFATKGQHALKSLEQSTFDLVLLDIMMPDMDGFEVCKSIKNNPDLSEIPVIFISAKTSIDDKLVGFECGGVDYITKPFESKEVLVRVKTHITLRTALQTIKHYNRRLENMLEIRTKELIYSERQAVFGQVVQGIVHNLKSPITAGFISSHMINQHVEDTKKTIYTDPIKELRVIKNAIDYISEANNLSTEAYKSLNDIVASLLAKSNLDRNEQPVPTDINKLLRTEIGFFEVDKRFKHNTHKEIVIPENPSLVMAIPSDLSQVFQNMIKNALDAMNNQKESILTLMSSVEDGFAKITISDNGEGILSDLHSKIFEPFYTTKPSASLNIDDSTPTGNGLGLWMCKEVIERLNGEILLTSEQDIGSTFIITIPLYEKDNDANSEDIYAEEADKYTN